MVEASIFSSAIGGQTLLVQTHTDYFVGLVRMFINGFFKVVFYIKLG